VSIVKTTLATEYAFWYPDNTHIGVEGIAIEDKNGSTITFHQLPELCPTLLTGIK